MADEKHTGHCPICSAERVADRVASHVERWVDEHVSGCIRHSILKCRGCETVYIQRAESCSEDDNHVQDEDGEWVTVYPERMTYWPAPTKRTPPEWVHAFATDRDLSGLLDELYASLNNDLRVLAAIAIRTIFDRASELLGVDPALSFSEKLAGLEAKGRVGADERANLGTLADAGGAAAHRGWRPTPKQLDTLVSTLEAFLYRTMVLGDALKELKASVPVKPQRGATQAELPAGRVNLRVSRFKIPPEKFATRSL